MTGSYSCDSLVCFTNDATVAAKWDKCLKDQTKKRYSEVEHVKSWNATLGRAANETLGANAAGKCEMIDFSMLMGEISLALEMERQLVVRVGWRRELGCEASWLSLCQF